MFECKKYHWLLSQLHKQKSPLHILDIYFIKSATIQSKYFTTHDGLISSVLTKQTQLKPYLETHFSKHLTQPDSDSSKPVLYLSFPTYKRVFTTSDLKEFLKKDQKILSIKEIILFQDYTHSYSTYYSAEIFYDGEGLTTTIYRKDYTQPEFAQKDSKYVHSSLSVTKSLAVFIENLTQKNILRLNYDFVVDPDFSLIVLYVTTIKLVHTKIVALNKGICAACLEVHVPTKTDFKTSVFPMVASFIKEPEPERMSPTVTSGLSTSIFKHFIRDFLQPKQRKRTVKGRIRQESEQMSPKNLSRAESKIETPINSAKQARSSSMANQMVDKLKSSATVGNLIKLPDLKFVSNPKIMPGMYLKGFKPNNTLMRFLKDEEERILERNSKRIVSFQGDCHEGSLEEKKKKKKKLKIRVFKTSKKKVKVERIVSPYLMLPSFK